MNSFNLALILSLAPLNQITLMMLCHSTGDGATTQTLRLVYKLHITPINRCFINWILTLLRYKFNVVGYHTRIRKPDPRVTSSLIRTMLATRGAVIYVNLSTSAEVTLELGLIVLHFWRSVWATWMITALPQNSIFHELCECDLYDFSKKKENKKKPGWF